MFCTNCGAQNKDDAKFCVKCGGPFGEVKVERRGPGTIQPTGIPSAEPLIIKGIWVVIKSFFGLPYRFVIDTFSIIKKIGKEGKLVFESTDVPFLNWIFTVGHVVITLISFIIILVGFILGLIFLASEGGRYGDRNITLRFFGMILVWILGGVAAFIQIWLSALWLEMVSLIVLLVNNTKRIVSLLEKPESPS